MQWYEILIAIAAVAIVVAPIVKKVREIRAFQKTGKLKCGGECSCCGCPHCASAKKKPEKKA